MKTIALFLALVSIAIAETVGLSGTFATSTGVDGKFATVQSVLFNQNGSAVLQVNVWKDQDATTASISTSSMSGGVLRTVSFKVKPLQTMNIAMTASAATTLSLSGNPFEASYTYLLTLPAFSEGTKTAAP